MLWLAAKPAHAQSFFKSVHLVETPTTQATAGGTTTLTLASQTVQRFTGTQNQTVVLPNATTLSVGMYFLIANDSTGILTINDASSGLVATVLASNSVSLRLITNGSAAGVWTVENNYTAVPASTISGIVPLDKGGTALANVASQGGIAYGTSSGISLTAAGVSGQAVISQGTASPSFYNPTPGGVLFAGTSGAISESAATFSWDSSTSRLQVGGGANTLNIHGTTSGSNLTISAQGGSNIYEVGIHRHNASTNPGIYLARSRGSEAAPSIVQNGDLLGVMDGLGFDGTDYEIGAQIDYVVDGTPGSNDMPGAILFKTTPDGAFTPATAATISNDKTLTLYGALDTALDVSGVVLTSTAGVISSRSQLQLVNGGTNNNIVVSQGGAAYGTASGISLTAAGSSGQFLKSAGTGVPNFAAITLSGDVSGVLPLANGGTANAISSIAGGAVYMTASVMSVTAQGISGQYLKSEGANAPIWTSTLNGQANIVNKTTTYTAVTTDDVITVTTGSAWTLTLYAASGNAGRVLRIKKTSSDLNALTIDGNASETIDGATTTSINTQYEEVTIVCDGSNWHILSRSYPSVWVAYTPTFVGFGTPTQVNVFSRRVGDSLELRGTFSTGTVTAAIASITLGYGGTNANVTLNTSKVASGISHVGQWASGTTTANFQDNVFVDSGATGVIEFGYQNGSQAGLTALNGNAAFGSSQGVSFFATIPISGWQ